ncbi:hypothetical protein [Microcoleus sp. CAWBG51]|uniref:hypothetical protein n=2 Tax=Microcoleus TaxID=44471 RepID=UPI0025F37C45|nr:hypothetical protein [Microcoleus sp. CAWBG51]
MCTVTHRPSSKLNLTKNIVVRCVAMRLLLRSRIVSGDAPYQLTITIILTLGILEDILPVQQQPSILWINLAKLWKRR